MRYVQMGRAAVGSSDPFCTKRVLTPFHTRSQSYFAFAPVP